MTKLKLQQSTSCQEAAETLKTFADKLQNEQNTFLMNNELRDMFNNMQSQILALSSQVSQAENMNHEHYQEIAHEMKNMTNQVQSLQREMYEMKEAMKSQGEKVQQIVNTFPLFQQSLENLHQLALTSNEEVLTQLLEVKTNIQNYENSITLTTEVNKNLPENIRELSLASIKQLLSEQNDMLETVLRNNHKIPSLIVIIPKVKNWKSKFDPRNIIRT